MDDDRTEALQSIQACLADLARWVLLTALKPGAVSQDRKRDIIRHAERIAQIAERL